MTAILGHVVPGPYSGDASALDPDSKVTRERAADWAYERLWGTTAPLRFDPEQGNRRMVTKGKTSRAISGKRILSATSAPLHPGGTPSYWRVA